MTSSPLRVLHMAEAYPPDYGGGAAVALRDICRGLAGRGHDVTALAVEGTDAAPYGFRSDADGSVRVDRINLPYFKNEDPEGWKLGLRAWRSHQDRLAAALVSYVDEIRPDVVTVHIARLFGEEPLIRIRERGYPVVWLLHDAWPLCVRLNLLRSPQSEICDGPGPLKCVECVYSNYDGDRAVALAKLPIRAARLGPLPAYRVRRRARTRPHVDGIISYSRFMADVHRPYVGGPVEYVPLGMDVDGAPTEGPARPRSPLRFGFMGGFSPIKGIWDVLDAAAALDRSGSEFELHVWGPGQEKGRADVASRGLDGRVRLRGMYGPDERWSPYQEIDVLLMATTVAENSPLVVREAATVGVPSIAPRVGGIPELVRDGETGLLYAVGDAADLERQMRRALEETGLFERLVASLAPPPTCDEMARGIELYYRNLLSGTSARPLAVGARALESTP